MLATTTALLQLPIKLYIRQRLVVTVQQHAEPQYLLTFPFGLPGHILWEESFGFEQIVGCMNINCITLHAYGCSVVYRVSRCIARITTAL